MPHLAKFPIFAFAFVCFFLNLSFAKERIDVVSYVDYLLPDEHVPYKYNLLKRDFDVDFHFDLYNYVNNFKSDCPELRKIIFFDYCESPFTIRLPYSKMICFKWEAIKIRSDFYKYYYRVYTFDDDLVDNIKFFKFYYPVLQPMASDRPSFEEQQLCVFIAGNWIPERLKILDFFNTQPNDSLHIYGRCMPPKYAQNGMYKGKIQGFHSGKEKLEILKNYRFCICFENTHTVPGYITEKIFDAFASGCVPIYWGPDNVEQYIPRDCFIDYRQFSNNEEMYAFMLLMTAEEHDQYIRNIQRFLKSPEAALFSQEHFEEILYQAAYSKCLLAEFLAK